MISIRGFSKAEVLAVLVRFSRAQGMSFMDPHSRDEMSVADARQVIRNCGDNQYYDYLWGRVLKVDLSGDEFDPRLYDRDNGAGTAARAIKEIR